MHQVPRCFGCQNPVEGKLEDLIFEAPCGPDHDQCSSAVFHPICLMRFRDEEQSRVDTVALAVIRLSGPHCPHGVEGCEQCGLGDD